MKFAASALMLVAAMLSGCADTTEPSCSPRQLRAPETVTINLYPEAHEMRKKPGFYLAGPEPNHYIVFFFKPEDVLALVEKRAERQDLKATLEAMRRDLPLDRDTDLFKYALRDQEFEFVLQYLLADLLDSGKGFIDIGLTYHPEKSPPDPNDEFDPRVILRVNWKTEGATGRSYCTDRGLLVHDVMDSIA